MSNLIYGAHAVRIFLGRYRGHATRLLYTHPSKIIDLEPLLRQIKLPYQSVSPSDMRQLGLREYESHQGIALEIDVPLERLLVDIPEQLITRSADQKKDLLLLPEVNDEHNLGAITRSAVAFGGVCGVLMQRSSAARLSRVSAKTSAGAIFDMRFAYYNSLSNLCSLLDGAGYTLLIIQNTSESVDLRQFRREPDHNYVITLGSEDGRINPTLTKHAHKSLKISHTEQVDSLNLSVCAGIVLHRLSTG